MNQKLRDKGKGFAKYMESLSQEKIDEMNKLQLQEAQEEHVRFRSLFSEGNCYLCNKSIKTFSKKTPCLHWLLRPKGFKKKDFRTLYEKYGVFQIQCYIRWVANEETFAKHINDIEGDINKIFELTIKYGNIEWSLSCNVSDYEGHPTTRHANYPHYHFQMRIDKKPFINFNDFHVPLTEDEIIDIQAIQSSPNKIKENYFFGEGMSDMFNEKIIEHVLNSNTFEENSGESPFRIDSRVMAKEGEKIDSGELYKIIEEAKSKGVSVASLLHKLPNSDLQVSVIPGPGVVKLAPRPKRKNAHNKALVNDLGEKPPTHHS